MGIDLASQASKTAACLISWSAASGRVLELRPERKLPDQALLALLRRRDVGKVGIDVPLGWPAAFIDALTSYRDTGTWPTSAPGQLLLRATERHVKAETGQQPLSVAVGYLAWPAMRCAGLLSELPEKPMDRSGSGWLAEVYPMAALRRWGVIPPGGTASTWSYKGAKPGRQERREAYLVNLLAALGERFEMTPHQMQECARSDDALDAFVCALIARATDLGLVDAIPPEMQDAVGSEGWIQLPGGDSLGQLVG